MRRALAAAFVAGALLALQSRLNGTLSAHSGRPVIAALWSFGSGLLVLTLLVICSTRVRRGLAAIPRAVQAKQIPWWQCLGGVIGGMLVTVQAWSVPLIGVAIFSVAMIGGQTLSAIGVDRIGLGPRGVQAITAARVAAAVVAVVGVAVSATAHSGQGRFSFWPVAIAFLIGGGLAFQQAVNGRVNRVSGHVMATTWQNFAVGMAALVVLALVQAVSVSGSWHLPSGAPWWAWLGAPCGIAFIGIAAWAVHEVGVLVFGLVSVAGQLIGALVVDLLDPATRGEVGPQLLLGLLITLLAAAGAGVAAARPARAVR